MRRAITAGCFATCTAPLAPETGARLWKTSEVDHRVPLFRVWREHRDTDWPSLLSFWGLPNLQAINRDAHTAKCATEAGARRRIPEAIEAV